MANTKELEDTLPLAAPNEPHHLRNTLNKKFAIYTSTSLEDAELQQLERDINGAGDSTSNSQLADRAVFESLRDIYDYHLEYRDRNQAVHPLYYIVADSKEWRSQGVLGVYLAAMSPKRNNVVGVCRCGVDAADMMGANLNIGNMDWYVSFVTSHIHQRYSFHSLGSLTSGLGWTSRRQRRMTGV